MVQKVGGVEFTFDTVFKTTGAAKILEAGRGIAALGKESGTASGLVDQMGNSIKITGGAMKIGSTEALSAAASLKKLQQNAMAGTVSVNTLTQGMTKVTSATTQATAATRTQSISVKSLTTGLQKEGSALSRAWAALKKYSTATKQASAETKKAGDNTKTLAGRMTDLSKSVQVALGPLSGVASRLTAIAALANRNTIFIAGLIGGFIALGVAVSKAIKVGIDYESQFKILENRTRTLGAAFGFTAEQLDKMAIKLGEDTLTNATEARNAIVVLSTSAGLMGQNFERALISAQDLTAQGLGGLIQNSRILARVLADPGEGLEGLARKGIIFEDSLLRQIKALALFGRKADAQVLILNKIEEATKGAAVAAADSLKGALDTLGERMTRFGEVISTTGDATNNFRDAVNDLSDRLLNLTETLERTGTASSTLGIAFKTLGDAAAFLLDNIDVLLFALGGAAAGKVLGSFIKLVGSAGGVLIWATTKVKKFGFSIALLLKTLTRLHPVLLVLGLVLGAIAALALRTNEVAKATTEYDDAIDENIKKLGLQKKATEDLGEAQKVQAIDALKATMASIEAQITATQELLRINEEAQEAAREKASGTKTRTSLGPPPLAKLGKEEEALILVLETLIQRWSEISAAVNKSVKQDKDKAATMAKLRKEGDALADIIENSKKAIRGADGAASKLQKQLDNLAVNGVDKVTLAQMKFDDQLVDAAEKLAALEDIIKDNVAIRDAQGAKIDAVRLATERLIPLQKEHAKLTKVNNEALANEVAIRKLIDAPRRKAIADVKMNIRLLRGETAALREGEDSLEQFTIQMNAFNTTIDTFQTLIKQGVDPEEALKYAKALAEAGIEADELALKNAKIQEGIDRLQDAGERFGLVFVSAFEEAVLSGAALGDILKGLEQDLIKLIFRLLVIEPLLAGISEGFENVLKGKDEVEGSLFQDEKSDSPLTQQGLGGLVNRGITTLGSFIGDDDKDEAGTAEKDLFGSIGGGIDSAIGEIKDVFSSLFGLGEAADATSFAFEDSKTASLAAGTEALAKAAADKVGTVVALTKQEAEAAAVTSLIAFTTAVDAASTALAAMAAGGGGEGGGGLGGLISTGLGIAGMFTGSPGPAAVQAGTTTFGGGAGHGGGFSGQGFTGPRAAGGPVGRGGQFLVGEQGPELFVPSVSGQIVPNNALGGGPRLVQNITFNVPPGNSANINDEQMAGTIMRRGQQSMSRGLS